MLPMHQFGQAGAHRVTPTFHLALEPQPFTLQLNTKSLLAKLKKKKKKKVALCPFSHPKSLYCFMISCTWSRMAAKGQSKEAHLEVSQGCSITVKRLDTWTSFVVSQTSAVAAGPWLN